MAFDYSDIRSTAQELVTDFGRTVTVRKVDRTPADSNQPWRAGGSSHTDVTPPAVFVNPRSSSSLGFVAEIPDSLRHLSNVAVVSAADDGGNNLEEFDEVIEGSKEWRIVNVELLQPGGTRLLYFLGLESKQ